MKTVAVLDYGMSNLRSVSRALEHVADKSWRVLISRDAQEIQQADKVVFPGQGAIGNCMQLLKETGLDQAVLETVSKKPFLGICLGLQSLLSFSEESGGVDGFNLVKGKVIKFADHLKDPLTSEHLKIPHMGWNQVKQIQTHPLWKDIPDESRFYFVHSFYAKPEQNQVIAATTPYPTPFVSAIAFENVFAVQFHPEKSQHQGLKLLENFLSW
jgi:glutamine amidotransferase